MSKKLDPSLLYPKYPNLFTNHHIDSFNSYLKDDLIKILTSSNFASITILGAEINPDKQLKYDFNITDIVYESPMEFSNMAGKLIKQYPTRIKSSDGTYAMSIYVKYKINIFEYYPKKKTEIQIKTIIGNPILFGKIPCMVLSNYCNLHGLTSDELEMFGESPNESGGIFIIKGNKYITVTQEYKTENFLYLNWDSKEKLFKSWIQSKNTKNFKYSYYTTVMIDKNDNLFSTVYVSKKNFLFKIPIILLFKVIGIFQESVIWEMITGYKKDDINIPDVFEELLYSAFIYKFDKKILDKYESIRDIKTSEQAKEVLAFIYLKSPQHKHHSIKDIQDKTEQFTNFINKFFDIEFLPHYGPKTFLRQKITYYSYMINETILLYSGQRKMQEIDDYGYKRLLRPRSLIRDLTMHTLRPVFHTLKKTLAKNLQKIQKKNLGEVNNLVERSINTTSLLNVFENRISTGELPVGGSVYASNFNSKVGVFANLTTTSIHKNLSPYQKIATSAKKKGSSGEENISIKRRQSHASHIFFLDPSDTPEGANTGIIKTKTLISQISQYMETDTVNSVLLELYKNGLLFEIEKDIEFKYLNQYGKLFVNGKILYIFNFSDIIKIKKSLLHTRRIGSIPRTLSIVVNTDDFTIKIFSDSGRLLTPFFIVTNGKLDKSLEMLDKSKITMQELLDRGIIELLHIHELKYSCLLAMTEDDLARKLGHKYSHCSISHTYTLGLNCLSIPYCEHQHGPRNTYATNQIKQPSGMLPNKYNNLDKKIRTLTVPHKPLVNTHGNGLTLALNYPFTQNLYLAITGGALNIEDAVIVNQGARDRGLMDIEYETTIVVKMYSNEKFKKPKQHKTIGYKIWNNYDKLNKNGWPKEGVEYKSGDILVGKVNTIIKKTKDKFSSTLSSYKYEDKSLVYKYPYPAVVQKIVLTKDPHGRTILKIKIISNQKLSMGDKIASASAQKSTIGNIRPQRFMIYDEDGQIIDVIFNFSTIIKRKTLGHMKLMFNGSNAIELTKFIDGTTFSKTDIEKTMQEMLEKYGFKYIANKTVYDGYTGKPMKAKIFCAYCSYYKLKQTSIDKEYTRSTGSVDAKTRQPLKGRSREGGLRLGEMERDGIIAHGTAMIIKELLHDNSDKYSKFVSDETRAGCVGNPYRNIFKDNMTNTYISKIDTPWIWNFYTFLILSLNFKQDIHIKKYNEFVERDFTKADQRVSRNVLTIYEKAILAGTRARHISLGSKIRIPIKKDIRLNLIDVALEELKNSKLNDYNVIRKMPNNKFEQWNVGELIIL